MTNKEKMNMLEELLDIEKDSLREEMRLDEISQWDSVAVIALIAMLDEDFDKTLSPSEVKKFRTVEDILGEME